MSQAIVALIGVIIGAAITGGVQYGLWQRSQTIESRAAARLVRGALLSAQASNRLHNYRRAVAEWREHRTTLARALSDREWDVVENAALVMDELAVQVEGDFDDFAEGINEMLKTEPQLLDAASALKRVASSRGYLWRTERWLS